MTKALHSLQIIIVFLAGTCATNGWCVEFQPADSTLAAQADTVVHHRFNVKQPIAPTALMLVGTLGAIEPKLTFNTNIDGAFPSPGSHTHVDDYLRFVPSAAHLALGFIPSVPHKHRFTDRLLVSATAHATMAVLSYSLKHLTHIQRPDSTDYKSFPSGHAAWAFTGAELVRTEYGNIYGLGAYAIATTVSILRLSRHRHWASDVLMGAGIGILSAHVADWLLPFERRLLGIDGNKKSPTFVAIPSFDPTQRAMTMSVVSVF
ncbi:MAG: phosphatase PAP2 family protein [Muribaculaceae bacterium]|nr:phosphatase PAP2 family protein [Muribaculaceae bacterium]